MTPGHRRVRTNNSFYDRLDVVLPAERTDTGVPSRFDFENYELPALVDLLAADYEGVTTARPEDPGTRVLISAGKLVHSIALYTELVDEVVVITWVSVQFFGEA